MSTPRVEVDLHKIRQNTSTLVSQLKARRINVTAVIKAACGHPAIAQAMLDGGAAVLGDARIKNVQRLRAAGITVPVTLIRTPMLSQADEVVRCCESSYNTEIVVIRELARAAIQQGRVHGIILMVEMGDLREGIMPKDLGAIAQQVVKMPGVALKGVGANFACLSGKAPDGADMRALSSLASETEGLCGPFMQTVSGGNSANLRWALGVEPAGRVNDLRLGEAILLGVDPISGDQIDGLHTDAFTLVTEVIETDAKPVPPLIRFSNPALAKPYLLADMDNTTRVILAIGHQDIDVLGLSMPPGKRLIGATSDHLVIGTNNPGLKIGSELRFQMNYSALMRAMAARGMEIRLIKDRPSRQSGFTNPKPRHLVLN